MSMLPFLSRFRMSGRETAVLAASLALLIGLAAHASFSPHADAPSEIARMNAELRAIAREDPPLTGDVSAAGSSRRALTVDLAKRRKVLYAELMRTRPEDALRLAFDAGDRALLHPEVQRHVEVPHEFEGRLEIFDIQDAASSRNEALHAVQERQGSRVLVYAASLPDRGLHGRRVAVKGIRLDHLMAVTSLGAPEESVPEGGVPLPEGPQVGTKRVAVILIHFPGTPTLSFRALPQEAREKVFTGTRSVNAFVQEASGGKLRIAGAEEAEGDVFGPYEVGVDDHERHCHDAILVSQRVRQQARKAGIDLDGYTNVVYLIPDASHCSHGWGTVGEVDGQGEAWLIGSAAREAWMIAHELGHNLGLQHANAYACPDATVPRSFAESCAQVPYGDPYDIMGGAHALRHFGNLFRLRLGWIAPEQVADVSGSGMWRLAASDPRSEETQVLRIPRAIVASGDPEEYYYLEYRRPSGMFDLFAPDARVISGITVRIGNAAKGTSDLVDANGPDVPDAILAPGQVFADAPAGIVITPVSLAPDAATVAISAAPPARRR